MNERNEKKLRGGADMPTTLSEKAKKVKSSSTLAITAKAKELKAKGEDVVIILSRRHFRRQAGKIVDHGPTGVAR